jgi:mycoredoxin
MGVVVAVVQIATGGLVVGIVELAVFAALAFAWSPLAFPRSLGAAQAQERSRQDGRPVIYWRPGCTYCQRLRIRLGRDGRRAHWVNIWADPAGAAAVRAITGGDETVPTVELAGQSHVNPDPAWLRERLRLVS